MSTFPDHIDEYYFGGTMWNDDPTYVTRESDQKFYEGLKSGKFCYVLNSRQMGKSSLRVRTMARLKEDGIICASIEITKIIGNDSTEENWYAGLIQSLVDSFNIDNSFDLNTWWSEHSLLSYVQRFSEFIRTIVLANPENNFVIFIDEIDSILKLGSPVDDFFAYIRSCWNERADKPEYRRLTFAILGVAIPSDLMQDKKRTPFNIGLAIELNGFSFDEAQPLAVGLVATAKNPKKVLSEILYWTGGQPFLTQKICQLIVDVAIPTIGAGDEAKIVSDLIHSHIIQSWEMNDDPEHLKTIQDRIFESSEKQTGRLLSIYQRILLNDTIEPDDSREEMELRLTGLVVKSANKLNVCNRIYGEVFSHSWLEKALKNLSPYDQALNAWIKSNYKDESRLLGGKALQDAISWSRGRNLSINDSRFLNASQDRQSKQRLVRRERQALQLGVIVSIVISLISVVGSFSVKKSIETLSLADVQLASIESKSALSDHRGLEAMIQAIRAGKKLQNLDKSVWKKAEQDMVLQVLQQANFRVFERNKLQGHTSYVRSAVFSPDGKKIVTASGDKTARIWNAQGKLLNTLTGHKGDVVSASFSPDGSRIVTASGDKTARIWDTQGKLLTTLTGHTGDVRSANFSPDGSRIVTASGDKTARIWDTQGKLLATLTGHTKSVWSAAFSPDGSRIVTASGDKTARIWDVQGNRLTTFTGHTSYVRSAVFSPDGKKIVTASGDETARIWDVQGNRLTTLTGHTSYVSSASFSPDGEKIVTASGDKTARIWDTKGRLLSTFTDHTSDVRNASFSPDGSKIVTASDDNTSRIWNAEGNFLTTLAILIGHTNSVWNASFSPDGSKIVTASDDNTSRIWNAQGNLLAILTGHTKSVWSAKFSPDGSKIVTASDDNTSRIWNTQGKLLATLTGHTIDISPDGSKIVTVSNDKIIRIWDNQGSSLFSLKGHTKFIWNVNFSPDGSKIVTASDDNTARIWDVQGNFLITILRGHTNSVWNGRFSPDGSKVVTVSNDKTARIWDIQGTILAILPHSGSVISARFSPNGSKIVTTSDDNTARIWDVQGNLLTTLTGHTNSVWKAIFSPDGSKIVTVSKDNTARIWDRIDSFDSDLDRLLTHSCNQLHDYLSTNPNVKPEDRELCGIKKVE
jgi:WD40 repeat protein